VAPTPVGDASFPSCTVLEFPGNIWPERTSIIVSHMVVLSRLSQAMTMPSVSRNSKKHPETKILAGEVISLAVKAVHHCVIVEVAQHVSVTVQPLTWAFSTAYHRSVLNSESVVL